MTTNSNIINQSKPMNLPNCPNHQDRRQQLICLSDDCSQKFEPRCVQCIMTSKCRQKHTWKLISEVVEEIHEICQTAQIRHQKHGKKQAKSNMNSQVHKKHIQLTLKEMKLRTNQVKQKIVETIENRANTILDKLENTTENFNAVKQILKACKRETQVHHVVKKLKDIGKLISCSEDGTLELIQNESPSGIGDIDISIFQNQSNKMIDNLLSAIKSNSNTPLSSSTSSHSTSSSGLSDEAKKNYEKQIEKLSQQVRELPIYVSRIQSLSQKLQAKQARLKKYQLQNETQNSQNSGIKEQLTALKKKTSQQIQLIKLKNAIRVKQLIERRQQLYNAFQQYTQKNQSEELYIYNLKNGVNATKLQVPVVNNVSYLLNQCSLSICDQLQFLGYSDSKNEESNIEVPLIGKKEQPKQKTEQIEINPLLLLLMGLR